MLTRGPLTTSTRNVNQFKEGKRLGYGKYLTGLTSPEFFRIAEVY